MCFCLLFCCFLFAFVGFIRFSLDSLWLVEAGVLVLDSLDSALIVLHYFSPISATDSGKTIDR